MIRLNHTWYSDGDWNVLCDVCGFQFKASEVRKRWDGLMVCRADWETQHPQDKPEIPRTERNRVTFARPEPDPKFLAIGEATAEKL